LARCPELRPARNDKRVSVLIVVIEPITHQP
jgi:hypothetical protein